MNSPPAKRIKFDRDLSKEVYYGFKNKEFILVRWKPGVKNGLLLSILSRLSLCGCWSIHYNKYSQVEFFSNKYEGLVLLTGTYEECLQAFSKLGLKQNQNKQFRK